MGDKFYHPTRLNGKQTVLYSRFRGMWRRCTDMNLHTYKNYGGRGISVADEWKDFLVFAEWAIKNGFAQSLQLDRIDNNGDYSPANCRYVTPRVNRRNSDRFKFGTKFNKKKNRYETRITTGGFYVYLGYYKTEKSAHKAYRKATDLVISGIDLRNIPPRKRIEMITA